ncbi:hypothetical protein ACFX15_021819 [Malus domestica]
MAKDDQVEDAPKHDTALDNPKDDDQDSTGHSILENLEITIVHVLPAEFQPTTHQLNFLDRDVVAKEATQVDFITTEEDRQVSKDDKLKTAMAVLFPRSSSVNLQHFKPLYVTAHVEGY